MSTGTWDPKQGATADNKVIDLDIIREFINYSESNQLDEISTLVSAQTQMDQRPLMSLEQKEWISVGNKLNDEEVIHLIRFFTIAESRLPGWDSGSKSPVIGLVKALKKRKSPPDQTLVLWIRENSDNRYLPHGPL